MTEDEREKRYEELMGELGSMVDRVIGEMNAWSEAGHFVATDWVLIAGSQEPTGDQCMTHYYPRPGQPVYVSMGLVEYQSARLKGQAASWAAED